MQSNTNGALLAGTTAVGMYPRGTWSRGPLDMTGNVLECCLNSYEEPTNTSVRAEGSRVLRGGSWNNNQDNARCAYRNNNHPQNRNNNIGFRCAKTSPASAGWFGGSGRKAADSRMAAAR